MKIHERPVTGVKVEPVSIVQEVVRVAGEADYIGELQADFAANGLQAAVDTNDSAILFDWLVTVFSFQGVSDAAARGYMARHGNPTYAEVNAAIDSGPQCGKLASFDAYRKCGYRKTGPTCSAPSLLRECPVPRFKLRKGQLNEAVVSLYLFLRDVCSGDLVGMVDRTLEKAEVPGHPDRLTRMREALLELFLPIRGVSRKVLNMTLSDLLIGAGGGRPRWVEVGASMVAVDTLVHAFLHRTGILWWYETDHTYGEGCYGEGRCADILDDLGRQIDASAGAADYPAYFPRMVQHAIWRYCAGDGLDVCNARRCGRKGRCENVVCSLRAMCGRVTLA